MRAGWSFSLAAFMALYICSAVPPECAVGVGRVHDQVLGWDAQLLFDSLRYARPHLFPNHACIHRNQGRTCDAVIDHNRPGIDVVEDSLDVFRQLRGRDIDLSRTGPERRSSRLSQCAIRKHGDQNCQDNNLRYFHFQLRFLREAL